MNAPGPLTALPTLIRGDARALPLPDESVDLVVTSPPYFGLRDYGTDTQIGSEPTPTEFLDALIACTDEMARVLKPTGSMFVNLGDKYGPNKNLLDLPWRYGIRCVDELGLIKRAEIIWAKPNGLPESVTDRVRRSHEVFVHLTKSPRYFAAVDEIREPHSAHSLRYYGPGTDAKPRPADLRKREGGDWHGDPGSTGLTKVNPLGKLPGSVWEIATQPLRVPAELGVDHFAAFPMEWPRRLILGWSPREVCTVCDEGRRPVTDATEVPHWKGGTKGARNDSRDRAAEPRTNTLRTITGYACACPDTSAPSTPGVVLDPFSGTGTTALVATMLGRTGIGVDLSADYQRLARWRCSDPKERARAAGLDPDAVARVERVPAEQQDLFAGLTNPEEAA